MASKILYFAAPNGNKNKGGFLPLIEVDGKVKGDTYSGVDYSHEDALQQAHERALDIADRFGDEGVIVAPRDVTIAKVNKTRRTKQQGSAALGVVAVLGALGGCYWLFSQGRGRS
jgi:hypothetical protein